MAERTADTPVRRLSEISRLRFSPAVHEQTDLRMVCDGPSGCRKTPTVLEVASVLGRKTAVIDTQRGASKRFADAFPNFAFDVTVLTYFSPDDLTAALASAQADGYGTVVIDSLTPFWTGTGGMLEQVDEAARRVGGGSSAGWKEMRPAERRMVEAMAAYPGHVLGTVRSRTEVVIEADEQGRHSPRRVGTKPEQREGFEYDWDVYASIDPEHTLLVTKAYSESLHGAVFRLPDPDFARQLKELADSGTPTEPIADLIAEAMREDATRESLYELWARVRRRNAQGAPMLTPDEKPTVLAEFITRRGFELRSMENETA